MEYTYSRYLSAKKTVDDRALNQHVVAYLRRELGRQERTLRVLDIGAGLGTMVARLVEWNVVHRATHVLLDLDSQSLADSRAWLRHWATEARRAVISDEEALRIRDPNGGIDVRVEAIEAELLQFLEKSAGLPKADLLLANAFLDLVDVPATLPALLDLLAPDGVYWFSINFDGDTIFEPSHPYDDQLIATYHRSMDTRVRHGRRAGDSRTGRRLFMHLEKAGARIAAAGSSDWVVHARDGHYEADEAYFLHYIVHTVDEELRKWSEIDPDRLAEWVATRHAQIDRGELVYIAHQLDFAGRRLSRS